MVSCAEFGNAVPLLARTAVPAAKTTPHKHSLSSMSVQHRPALTTEMFGTMSPLRTNASLYKEHLTYIYPVHWTPWCLFAAMQIDMFTSFHPTTTYWWMHLAVIHPTHFHGCQKNVRSARCGTVCWKCVSFIRLRGNICKLHMCSHKNTNALQTMDF